MPAIFFWNHIRRKNWIRWVQIFSMITVQVTLRLMITVPDWTETGVKRFGILLRIFWYKLKVCHVLSTYGHAHAKAQKWIFWSKFTENPSKFKILWNGFESPTNSAFQNKNSSIDEENPKILGIQPIYKSIFKFFSKPNMFTMDQFM